MAKTGRPSKYDPAMCDEVVRLGAEGYGRAEIAASLGVCRETLRRFELDHPEFLDAMTRASDLSLAWWGEQGRKGIWAAREFNAQAYRLQVCNRFPADWRDKREHEHSGPGGAPLQVAVIHPRDE